MTYDVARRQAVLFLIGSGGGPGETWTWDGSNWRLADNQRSAARSPYSRRDSVFTYHGGLERVLMYGGVYSSVHDDQWTWDGTSWMQSNLGLPTARGYQQQMAFDTDRQQAVLFGGVGYGFGQILSDTWTWNGAAWTLVRPVTIPPERAWAAITYDSARHVTVLFGGRGGDGPRLGDTWTFESSNWTEVSPATGPPALEGSAIAFDSASQKVVLFGGVPQASETDSFPDPIAETWTWDGTAWTREQASVSPPARVYHSMARDREGRPVIFGGENVDFAALNDTWRWDSVKRTWEQMAVGGPVPPPRFGASMGYNAATREIVLFGGTICVPGDCHADADTWTWDGTAWTEQHPATSPSFRSFTPMADGSAAN
ncbi:MAG: kelch motif-containing protein, partial [Acidobacteria bacterium]|nr:kelch motif-containing protein [Acidobacteriota bacterium]